MPLTPDLGAAKMLREGILGTFGRSRKRLIAAGLSLILALVGQSGPRPAAAFMPTGTSTWVWQNPLPQGNPLRGVSCADVSHCVFVGDAGTTLSTSNGGAAWQGGASATDTSLVGVSCPTISICFSVGDVGLILRSDDGGARWSSQVSGTTKALYGISCPTSTTCFAVGASGTIQATTNGGSTWTAQVVSPPASANLNAVSCAGPTACVAVGTGIAIFTRDGGASWNAGTLPVAAGLTGVSCPNPTVCFAVGDKPTVFKTMDGGVTWAALPPNTVLSGFINVSCPSTTTCLAGAYPALAVTKDGGTTWSTKSQTDAGAADCPSLTRCFIGGLFATVATTSDTGDSWSMLSYTVTSEPLVKVRCPSTSTCFALGNEAIYHRNGGPYPAVILGTTDGGRTWLKRYETSLGGLYDISCPTASSCFVSLTNAILSTSDGGRSWTQQTVAPVQPDGTTAFALSGIDCPTTIVCFAVGSMPYATAAIVYTTNGWATWTVILSAGPHDLSSVSCPNIHTCVATGYAGMTMRTTDGVHWSVSTAPTAATEQLGPVDCPSASACFAVAGAYPTEIFATTDGGVTWSPQSLPPVNAIGSVDCPTPSTCLVASRGGVLSTTNGGTTWSLLNAGTANDLIGVDCPAITMCFAVGANGTILALPPGPAPPWWTQPAQTPTVSRPPGPWYVQGTGPAPASTSTPHAAPRLNQTRVPPLPGRSLMSAAMQAEIARALGGVTQQISRALQAIVS